MIINSLLDTDLYKLTMQQAVLHQFPGTEVEYEFKCRNEAKWNDEIVRKINEELDNLCTLRLQPWEAKYLSDFPFFKKDYIDFLKVFQFNRDHIFAYLEPETKNFILRIRGSWLLTILFEVPVLAIVNETYHKYYNPDYLKTLYPLGRELISQKAELVTEDFHFSDFGTRRRFSYGWQREMLSRFIHRVPSGTLLGTSNVQLAMDMHLKPIGTMAHEWIMAGQNIGTNLINSQKKMLQAWNDEYRGYLGIALTDTLGIDAFIRDFDLGFSKMYDGVRHDSGDPITWGEQMLEHYRSLKIDAKTKTLVFSDSLTIPKAIEIKNHFKSRINVTFGIGTNLTNDFGDKLVPLNIVIKMTKCNGQPVAKISDSSGKGMCKDEEYLKYLKSIFRIKE
jgi:nicotinate phosphoribosyltransferase